MNAIELNNISKCYKNFKLGELSLSLPEGCIMGLIGENGAGKSTVIRILLNMIARDSGTVSLLGTTPQNSDEFAPLMQDIGVVLDEVGIPGNLNARQVGNIMRHSFANWEDAAYAGYLKALSVPENKKFSDFSRGTKMKLGLAAALSHHPKLLILDEATAGLDPVARNEVMRLLSEFTRDAGHSVLISSHIVSDLEKVCDYIAFLHQGQLLLCEEKDALKERYASILCTSERFARIAPDKVLGYRQSPYGVEAMVERDALDADEAIHPVDLEQLFIYMVKEAKQ